MIPYGRQDVLQADIDAVEKVLRSDYLTQGPVVPIFEKLVSEKVGSSYAVAVNSATSALHIACLSLGLGSNDWLWTTPISFVASANCALYCGAKIDFVDIDPDTFNMSVLHLKEKLERASKDGCLPKVVVAVHFAGQSCDMRSIKELSDVYGFKIIEDASHAVGGSYSDKLIGGCEHSDITIFSFHPVKIITSAEGGMALTNNHELYQQMSLFRSHGITRDPKQMLDRSQGPWYYEQLVLGYNYRMTDIHAALGISQLSRLDDYVAKRNQIAKSYGALLNEFPVRVQRNIDLAHSAWHIFVVRLELEKIKRPKLTIFEDLLSHGIGVNVHYIPIHMQPYYRQLGFKVGQFPNAERYYSEAITLPIFPTMTVQNLETVIGSLREALGL